MESVKWGTVTNIKYDEGLVTKQPAGHFQHKISDGSSQFHVITFRTKPPSCDLFNTPYQTGISLQQMLDAVLMLFTIIDSVRHQ